MITPEQIREAIHTYLKKQAEDTCAYCGEPFDERVITYDGDIDLNELSEAIMRIITTQDGKVVLSNEKIGQPEDDGYVCDCHRLLGNDFYFLPWGSCLHDELPCKKRDEWRAANPVKP